MASSKYLVSPHIDPSKEKLWSETWKRIDRFLPELRGELALDGRLDRAARAPLSEDVLDLLLDTSALLRLVPDLVPVRGGSSSSTGANNVEHELSPDSRTQ